MGNTGVPVLATPFLIGLLENAAAAVLRPEIPVGGASVGTMVEMRHLAATPVGMTVRAKATLLESRRQAPPVRGGGVGRQGEGRRGPSRALRDCRPREVHQPRHEKGAALDADPAQPGRRQGISAVHRHRRARTHQGLRARHRRPEPVLSRRRGRPRLSVGRHHRAAHVSDLVPRRERRPAARPRHRHVAAAARRAGVRDLPPASPGRDLSLPPEGRGPVREVRQVGRDGLRGPRDRGDRQGQRDRRQDARDHGGPREL